MITALDTNVLLDVLLPDDSFFDLSLRAIERAATEGSLVICDLVYAELCVHFESRRECDAFLSENDIAVEPLNHDASFLAGRAWRKYHRQGGKRSRILPDFLIGAHATTQASRLLSRDRGFYGSMFPSLDIFDPSR